MSCRMVVTDLDRTLLQEDGSISPYTTQVFHRLKAQGIRIAVATARPRRVTVPFADQIGADAVIVHNGSIVYAGEETLFHTGIPTDEAKDILLRIAGECPGALLCLEMNDKIYANRDTSHLWTNVTPIMTDFGDIPTGIADKLILDMSAVESLEGLGYLLPPHLYLQLSEGTVGLIMHKQATKLNGVKALAAYFGVSLEETAAFGDDTNDLEMILACGTGIAVANAGDNVKAAADQICRPNTEDGVAHWLEEYVLETAKSLS